MRKSFPIFVAYDDGHVIMTHRQTTLIEPVMITTSKSFTVCAERADQIARIVAAFGERRDVIIAIDFNDADETITVHIDDDSQPYDRQYVFEIGSDDDALVFVNPDDINDSVIIPLD